MTGPPSPCQHFSSPFSLTSSGGLGFIPILFLMLLLSQPLASEAAQTQPYGEAVILAFDFGSSSLKVATVDKISNALNEDKENNNNNDYNVQMGTAAPVHVQLLLNDQAERKNPPCVGVRRRWEHVSHLTEAEQKETISMEHQGLTYRVRRRRVFGSAAATLLGHTPYDVVCAPTEMISSIPDLEPTPRTNTGTMPAKSSLSETPEPKVVPFATEFPPEAFTAMLIADRRAAAARRDEARERLARPEHAEQKKQLLAELQASLSDKNKKSSERRGGGSSRKGFFASWVEEMVIWGLAPRRAAIAVPSASSLHTRQRRVDAGALAGLRVVSLPASTTAAAVSLAVDRAETFFPHPGAAFNSNALAHGNENLKGQNQKDAQPASPVAKGRGRSGMFVQLLDIGSRHSEAAVVWIVPRRRVRVLAAVSDPRLSGDAFDRCIVADWVEQYTPNAHDLLITQEFSYNGETKTMRTLREDFSLDPRDYSVNNNDIDPSYRSYLLKEQKRLTSWLRAAKEAREKLSVNREVLVLEESLIKAANARPVESDDLNRKNGYLDNNNNNNGNDKNSNRLVPNKMSVVLSREHFEQRCEPLFEAARQLSLAAIEAAVSIDARRSDPIDQRTKSKKLKDLKAYVVSDNYYYNEEMHEVPLFTPDQLQRLEVLGGVTRTPRLLSKLGIGRRKGFVRQSLDNDEAVVFGTAYLGARAQGIGPAVPLRVEEFLSNNISAILTRVVARPNQEKRGDSSRENELSKSTASTNSINNNNNNMITNMNDKPSSSSSLYWSCQSDAVTVFSRASVSLPTVRSLVWRYRGEAAVAITLASPSEDLSELIPQMFTMNPNRPETATSQEGKLNQKKKNPSEMFLKHYRLERLPQTLRKATTWLERRQVNLVAEVAVSGSGLPYLRKMYAYIYPLMGIEDTVYNDKNNNDSAKGHVVPLFPQPWSPPDGLDADDYDDEDDDFDEEEEENNNVGKVRDMESKGFLQNCLARFPRTAQRTPGELEQLRDRLETLRQEDEYEAACDVARNALETDLVHLRMTDAWDSEAAVQPLCVEASGAKTSSPSPTNNNHSKVFVNPKEAALCAEVLSSSPQLSQKDLQDWRHTAKELTTWLEVHADTEALPELQRQQHRAAALRRLVTELTSHQQEKKQLE